MERLIIVDHRLYKIELGRLLKYINGTNISGGCYYVELSGQHVFDFAYGRKWFWTLGVGRVSTAFFRTARFWSDPLVVVVIFNRFMV